MSATESGSASSAKNWASSMSELLVLSRREVAGLMPSIPAQLDLVERTYVEMAEGEVELPPKPGIHPRPDAFIHAMPAYLRRSDVAALKWVSGYPTNRERGLPYISGVIVVNDSATGVPRGLLDAAEITAARTAAASGVCIRRFAPPGWRQAAILGCGEQGLYHAAVLRSLNPDAFIRAYDPDRERARALPGHVEVVSDPKDAVHGSQVVITAGPIVEDPRPVIGADWLDAAHLLLPIDFDFYLRAEAIAEAELFTVDDIEQYEYYRRQGHFAGWPEAGASIGSVLAGRPGKISSSRTACVNLGVGALDAAFADLILRAAAEAGDGTRLML
jgi:alanine dehydrogenase